MRHSSGRSISKMASPPRNSRYSHSEQTDEAPGLIESEQVEVEREIPADDNQPIERSEQRGSAEPPVFGDGRCLAPESARTHRRASDAANRSSFQPADDNTVPAVHLRSEI